MPSITEAIQQLAKFSAEGNDEISNICYVLYNLLEAPDVTDNVIENLRNKLKE